ncbi:MAG: alpha/beta hydrolase, partial [Gammaproteobacteria bacterium]
MKKSILKGVKCLTLIPIMLGVSSTATLANAVDYEDSENSYEYSFEAETKHEFNSFDNIEAGQENYKEFILEGSDYSEDDLQPSVITQYNEKIPVGNEPNSPYVTPNPITGQTPKSAFARMITNDVLNFGKVKIEDPTVKTDQSFSDLRWSLWADWINLTMKKGNGLQDGARLIIEPDTGTYLKINKISQKGLTYEADVTLHVNGNLAFWGEVDSGWNGYGIDTWTTDDSYVNFDVDFKFTYSPTYNSSSKQFSLNPNVEVSHKNFAWYIYVRTSVDYSDEIADEVYQKLLEKIRDNVVPGFVSQIRDKFQAKVQAGNQVFSLGGIEPQWESQIDKIVKNYNGAGKYVKAATDRINYLLWSNNALSGTGLLLEAVACDDLTSTNPSAYMNTTMTRDGIDFNNYESSTIADHCDMIIGQEGFNLGDATNLNGPTPWTEAWGTTLRNTLLSRDVDHNHLPLMSRDRYQYVYGINDWVRYFDKQGWEEVKNQYAIEKNQYDADMDLWVSRCAPSTASLSDATPAVIDCNNFPVAPIEPDIDDYRGKVKQPRGTGRCDLEMRTYTNNPDSIENTAPVMIIHGGSWKTRYGSFSAAESYVSHLTNRGYTVYMPFYRLTGKNADTTEACQGANWERINGSTSFTPVSGNERAMEYVQNRHPGQQIKLIGFSAGSNMALNIVQKNPDDISKAILFYPPTDLEEFYDGYYTGTDNPDYIGNYGSANRYSSTYDHMAGYLEDFLLIKDFNDINVTRDYFYENSLAKKISESPASYPPLYIMHSAKDNTVPWRQSMHLCNAYGGTLGDSSVENGSVTKLEWTGARRKFECNPESSHPTIFDYLKRGVATYGNSPIHAFDVDIPGFGLIVNDSDKKEFTHSIKSALYWLDTDNVVRFKSPSIDDIQVSVSGDSAILDVKVSHPSGSSKVQSVYAYAVPCVHVSGEDWECELTDLPQGIYSNQLYVWAEDVYGNRGVPELVPPFEITAVNYTVSANAGNGGHITPSVQTVEGGYSAAFTVTPSTGYRIASVTGCNGSLSGNTYTTGAITGDCTVQANFSK